MIRHKYHILILWLSLAFTAMGQEAMTAHPKELVIEDSASFLRASLMIAEPTHQHIQSSFGHAFLRMQCPSAALDYCFSMESGEYEDFLDICTGHYPNRLVAVPTTDYLQPFDHEGRTVTEYTLNLRMEEMQHLWQFLDKTCLQGLSPYHDYFHHGCSQEIMRYLTLNLDGQLVYGEAARQYGNTLFRIGNQLLPGNSWLHLPPSMLSTTDGTDRQLTDDEKTAFPCIIPELLSDAYILDADGSHRPILKEEAPIIYQPARHYAPNTAPPIYIWFLLALGTVLFCSLLEIGYPTAPVRALGNVLDGTLFTFYQLITFGTLLICIFSTLPTTSGWNWNYLIYNPLPLMVWIYDKRHPLSAHRRAYLYLCYALWLTVFMVVMFIIGGHFITEQYLLALTFTVRCLFKAYQYRHSINNV